MFGLILFAPVLQLILMGYAANMDLNTVHTVVMDNDRSSSSRDFVQKFDKSGYFKVESYADNYREAMSYVEKGNAIFVLVIPNGFEKAIESNRPIGVQALIDASDGNKASIAAGYVQSVTQSFSRNIVSGISSCMGGRIVPIGTISAETRVWYNPEMKARRFMVPGLFGVLLILVTLLLTSLAIVKEKEIGTMEQLIVTPIKPYQIIIGKLVPFCILGFVVMTAVLNAMNIIFGITVRGSLPFLYVAAFVYILCLLGLGLFISTISKTQQQAMMLSSFVVMMPMIYLSGFAFPIENMPKIIQYITYLIPLRYFLVVLRGVILKGLGFADLWEQTLVLLIMGILLIGLASLRFNKKLD